MNIVLIGSGNVAAVLGRKFHAAGHQIIQVVSRNASAASELAYEWDTESANYMSLLNKSADVYIIAVSDNAIGTVADDLKLPGKVVAHTAGSVSKDILKNVTDHYGVFYPLQSVRKEMNHLPDIPVFYEGSDDKALSGLKKLAESISYKQPVIAGSEDRMKLHVAAVVVSNFTNHLFALAEQFCKKEGIDFRQLLPLIRETVQRLQTNSPADVMTGPAFRRDEPTVQKHIEVLNEHPHLQKVYKLMTESIQQSKN
jgi:predicted short-subunit dehydrogenase-like oxidoreductase (DUF2520 family)